jgi:hypothetical protein
MEIRLALIVSFVERLVTGCCIFSNELNVALDLILSQVLEKSNPSMFYSTCDLHYAHDITITRASFYFNK